MSSLIIPEADVYVLRSCASNMTSYGGRFTWPKIGVITAPDWRANDMPGYGLHGFLWGEGNGDLANWADDSNWLVVKVLGGYFELNDKVKFQAGDVVFCGNRAEAVAEIIRLGATGLVMGATIAKPDKGVAASGYRGTATAGYGGTATAGYRGTATAGYGGTIVILHWDGKRYRIATGYVGEDGILPDTLYQLVNGKLVEVSK